MSVLVAVPVKFPAGQWLHIFLKELDKLKGVSRCVFSYGQPDQILPVQDPTFGKLLRWIKETRHQVEIYDEPKVPRGGSAFIAPIYRDFQELMSSDESHVFMLDSDIMKMPGNIIQRLKRLDKDIVAPYVWIRNHVPPMFFDSFCFRLDGKRFHPFRPPQPKEPFPLDSVGTCMLVKRKPFKEIPYRNPYSHMNFCNDARAAGYEVWTDPRIKIYHIDLTRLGIFHNPVTQERPSFIRDDGTVANEEEIIPDIMRAFIEGEA